MPRTPAVRKTAQKPERFDSYILGKIVGTMDGWDSGVDEEYGVCDFYIYKFRRNALGKAAFPDFMDGKDLYIDFVTGLFQEADMTVEPGDDKFLKDILVNWTFFNE